MVQKIKNYNKLYGLLTGGEPGYRKSNYGPSTQSDYIADIVSTLIPGDLSGEEKAHRAELFIKLALTDISCCELIEAKDPYNSYRVVTYNIDISTTYDIEDIGNKLKLLHLKYAERDFGAVEHIINAIRIILESL